MAFEDGSHVELLQRESVVYVEGNLSMETGFLYGPGGFRGKRIILASQILKWGPPNQSEPLSEERKFKIIKKFETYCSENRIKYTIEGDFSQARIGLVAL